MSKLKEGQTIHFTLTNNQGTEYDAKIYGIGNTFEPNTKAVAVHAQVLGNKKGLIDGMSITAVVSLNDATVNAVPTEAIVSAEGMSILKAKNMQKEMGTIMTKADIHMTKRSQLLIKKLINRVLNPKVMNTNQTKPELFLSAFP